ncbi:MAG: hypothetical protein Q7J45_03560 [bacterium]|nr:hypothetical protein [bacterium]
MDKQKIIWIAVAIVVLGGAWYLFSGSSGGSDETGLIATTTSSTSSQQTTAKPSTARPTGSGTTTQKPVAPTKVAGVNTLSYLYSFKQPLVCSVTVGTTVKRAGTMYVADAKMRVNFSTASMIDDGSFLYVWKKGATTGLKLSAVSSVSGSAIAVSGGFDPANPFSFSCSGWTKDVSILTPPGSVTFSNNP